MSDLLFCPFCGGDASTYSMETWWVSHACDCLGKYVGTKEYATEAEAIAAWNTRSAGTCEPPYDELLRCLENDWNIRASCDGLRKFWCIELTEEGVKLRDAELRGDAE